MSKRLLSLFLVLCMTFTMLPSTAFAAESGAGVSEASGMEDSADAPAGVNHEDPGENSGYIKATPNDAQKDTQESTAPPDNDAVSPPPVSNDTSVDVATPADTDVPADAPEEESGVIITAFEPLGKLFTETAPGVYTLEAEAGTARDALALPDTLKAKGYKISSDTAAETASSSNADSGKAPLTSIVMDVTWSSEPEYDSDADVGQTFTFSAQWDEPDYILDDQVQAPVITVKLTEPKAMMSLRSIGDLTTGGTYYFDLSEEAGNIGVINPKLPDPTLHYVPFTYTGEIQAQSYEREGGPFDLRFAFRFVADYNVSTNISWDDLNDNGLIFGKPFDFSFKLRSLSGSEESYGDSGQPLQGDNEWDRILNYAGKAGEEWIKNWKNNYSWAQDSASNYRDGYKTLRGGLNGGKGFQEGLPSDLSTAFGWRPAIVATDKDKDNVHVITLDLNGGTCAGAGKINLVRGGDSFVISDSSLVAPKGKLLREWNTEKDGRGTVYANRASVPSDVGTLYAQWDETGKPQFNLPVGGTYYFDLSDEAGVVDGVNPDLPDKTLHYVPFTYAGTVYGYSLKSRSADDNIAKTDSDTAANSTDPHNPIGFTSDHSLFVSDYNINDKEHEVTWKALNTDPNNLIFGKPFDTHYTLRSLSGGNYETGSSVTPDSNEWDLILQKSSDYIKNCDGGSWAQDTWEGAGSFCVTRGKAEDPAYFDYHNSELIKYSWRPALEVLNPAMLGQDGLTAITLNLNGGKLKDSDEIAIICAGDSYKAPGEDGLTAPEGAIFEGWNTAQDGKGDSYASGADVPKNTTTLYAQWYKTGQPQFHLPDGGTYYFDLSDEAGIVDKVNSELPDQTLHYVPFTYAGTVYGYSLKSRSPNNNTAKTDSDTAANSTDPNNPIGFTSDRSLFVSDYNVSDTFAHLSWDTLNTNQLIFGKPFAGHYLLRTLSGGSSESESGAVPDNNEWDLILQKSPNYIKNYDESSWVQDTLKRVGSSRVIRGTMGNAAKFDSRLSSMSIDWRPALEVLNPATLGQDGLTAITLNLNGGKLKDSGEIAIICAGDSFTAPDSAGLTRPFGDTGSYFKWNTKEDGSGINYEAGIGVPKDVTTLYAQWVQPFIFTPSSSYDIPASTVGTAIADIDVSGGVLGGTAPYQFSASDLPAGIVISRNGMISGAPTATSNAGSATITVTDSTVPTPKTASITVDFGEVRKAAGPAAPSVTFSFSGENADKLMGVTEAMEYRLDGGSGETGWISCTPDMDLSASRDSITAEHDIKIRLKETDTHFAGGVQTIDITQAAEPNLTASQPATIGGQGTIPMTTAHEYSTAQVTWLPADPSGKTALDAGTYYARVKAVGTVLASPSQTIVLIAFTGTKQPTPTAVFTAADDKGGTLNGVTAGMKYSIDDGASWTAITGTSVQIPEVTVGVGVKVMMPGDRIYTTDSEIQAIAITQAAEPNLTADQPTTIGGQGTIPMTTAHEYSTDQAVWTTAAAGPTSLDAGTYYVRVKAVGTMLASPFQTITLTAFTGTKQPTPTAVFTAADDKGGTLNEVTVGMKYSTNGGTDWTDITGTSIQITNVTVENGVQVKMSGDGIYTTDSDVQTIDITQAAVPNLTVDQPTTIGGQGTIHMTAAHEYSTDQVVWAAAAGPTSLDAGTYYVRVKAVGTMLASPFQTITLTAFTGTKQPTPTAVFTAADDKGGALNGVTAGMKYSIDDGASWTAITETSVQIPEVTVGVGVKVMMPGDRVYTTDSDVQTIDITQAAVPNLTVDQPTTISGQGTIHMTAAHEYSTDQAVWTAAAGPTSLDAGTYYVRVKAVGTMLASPFQTITLTAFTGTKQPTPTAVFTAADDKGGTLNEVTVGMKYSTNDGTDWTAITGTSIQITNVTVENGVQVKMSGDGIYTTDSDVQTIDITQAAVPNLTPDQPTTISGQGTIPMTVAHEYSTDKTVWTAAAGITSLDAGTYYVRVKAVGTMLASPFQTIMLTAFTGTPEPTPAAVFTAADDKGGTLNEVTVGMKYSTDGGTDWTDITGTSIQITNVTVKNGVQVKMSGDGIYTTDSNAQIIPVTQADMPNLTAVQPDTLGGQGTIPMTTAHEYSTDKTVWTAAAGETSLDAGTYYVRVKAAGTMLASPFQTISLTAFTETDKTALYEAIQNAENIMANTVVSTQNGNDVPTSVYWVSPEIMNAAQEALTEAKAAAGNPDASQAEVDNAVAKLNQTINIDFKNAKRPGTESGGNGGSSSGGRSDTSSGAAIPPADYPNTPAMAETDVTANVDGEGGVQVTVSADTVDDVITKAQEKAKNRGTEENGIAVQINVKTGVGTGDAVTVNLPQETQERLIAADVSDFIIASDSPNITISFNSDAIRSIYNQAKADVQISAVKTDVSTLSPDAQAAIGGRPAFELKAVYGNGNIISNFGNGSVSVTIPYVLQGDELAGNIQAVYVDGNNSVEWLAHSNYDSIDKVLRFLTNHFSTYGVGCKTTPAFTDISSPWTEDNVLFAVNRDLLSGTDSTTFAPDAAITRGMLVTALGRLAGINPNEYPNVRFTDVAAADSCAPYAEWAAEKGIVSGTSDATFAPDQAVTHQEMAVIMANYAGAMGDSVNTIQMAGILSSGDGNLFDPQKITARAEAAAVLRHYVELVIDPAGAQGWTENSAGHWYYYKDGVKLVGWQQIDGTWYYFNPDGSMAVNTTVDGYEIGADGARKEKQ